MIADNVGKIFLLLICSLVPSYGGYVQDSGHQVEWQKSIQKAKVLLEQNNHEKALWHGKQAVDLAKSHFEDRGDVVANSLLLLARIYHAKENFYEAEHYYTRSIDLYRQASQSVNHDMMDAIDDLARLYTYIDEYGKAESLYEKEVVRRKKILGATDVDTVYSIEKLVEIHLVLGNFDKAEMLLLELEAVKEQLLEKDGLVVAGIMKMLGDVYRKSGNYASAQSYYGQAMKMVEAIKYPETNSGAGNEKIPHLYLHMSWAYAGSGDEDKADIYYRQALETAGKSVNADDVFYILDSQAKFYSRGILQNYAKRVQAIEALEKLLEEHVSVPFWVWASLGDLYSWEGKDEKSKVYFERALQAVKKSPNASNYEMARILQFVGQDHLFSNNYSKAKPYYEEALQKTAETVGAEHHSNAMILTQLGLIHLEQGDYQEAKNYLERAIKIADANQKKLSSGIKILALNYLKSTCQKSEKPSMMCAGF